MGVPLVPWAQSRSSRRSEGCHRLRKFASFSSCGTKSWRTPHACHSPNPSVACLTRALTSTKRTPTTSSRGNKPATTFSASCEVPASGQAECKGRCSLCRPLVRVAAAWVGTRIRRRGGCGAQPGRRKPAAVPSASSRDASSHRPSLSVRAFLPRRGQHHRRVLCEPPPSRAGFLEGPRSVGPAAADKPPQATAATGLFGPRSSATSATN